MYTRIRDIFNRPIASVPGPQFELTERISDDYNWTYRYSCLHMYFIDMFIFF
jgi:serine palmitoyltransferase